MARTVRARYDRYGTPVTVGGGHLGAGLGPALSSGDPARIGD